MAVFVERAYKSMFDEVTAELCLAIRICDTPYPSQLTMPLSRFKLRCQDRPRQDRQGSATWEAEIRVLKHASPNRPRLPSRASAPAQSGTQLLHRRDRNH